MTRHLRKSALILLAWAFLLGLGSTVHAQGALVKLAGENAPKEENQDPLGRTSPRSTLLNFVKAASLGNLQDAREYLQIPPKTSPEQIDALVTQFQTLLDHAYDGDLDSLNDQEIGAINDGLPENLDEAGTISVEGEQLEVILIRVTNDNVGPIWLVSAGTVAKVPELYAKYAKTGFEEKFPSVWVKTKIFRLPLWLIIAAILLFPVLFGISWLIVHGTITLFRLFKRVARRELSPHHSKAAKPFILQLTFMLHFYALDRLGLPLLYRQYYERFIHILAWVLVSWLLFILIDALTGRIENKLRTMEALSAQAAFLMVAKVLKALVVAGLILVVIRSLGFNINAALATLGLGGIALAFAAQKSLENLFGGVSLLSDRAIQVGDLCRFGTYVGTVEDIGLRSTRLRTLDRTLLLVPNGTLSSEKLENLSRRDKYLFNHILGLRYQTKLDELKVLKKSIHDFLEEHHKVDKDIIRVQLVRLGSSSLDLEIFAYILARDPKTFFTVQEQLLFRILELVEEAGVGLALPPQTTVLGTDSLSPLAELIRSTQPKTVPEK